MADEVTPANFDFEHAFDALVRAHYERLGNLAYRYLRSDAAAEDAVQEVLLKVWRRRDVLCMADPLLSPSRSRDAVNSSR